MQGWRRSVWLFPALTLASKATEHPLPRHVHLNSPSRTGRPALLAAHCSLLGEDHWVLPPDPVVPPLARLRARKKQESGEHVRGWKSTLAPRRAQPAWAHCLARRQINHVCLTLATSTPHERHGMRAEARESAVKLARGAERLTAGGRQRARASTRCKLWGAKLWI